MKIGILTYHWVKNYGGNLQAYALKETLKEIFQCKVNIIDYRPDIVVKPYAIINKANPVLFLKTLIASPVTFQKYKKYSKFIKQYGNLSKQTYYQEEELKIINQQYDVFITGSDQVWNTRITGQLLDSYCLSFADQSKKRISYAASIGNSEIEEKYKEQYKEKLNQLDAISVREETAQKLLQPLIDKKIEIVLDPTLLLNKEKWNRVAIEPKIKSSYILVYSLEENKQLNKIVNYIAKITGLDVITFDLRNKYVNGKKSAYMSGPREFIGWFKKAEYVITNSFHGTIFSLIYHKKFYTIPHSNRGSRMTDLLSMLNLSDRVLYHINDLKEKNLEEEINYKTIEEVLYSKQEQSIQFLKRAVKGEENE
ncbi:MAG: polysaccharide pyruvyl transferase family protein [Clostridia bacterium]